MENIQQEFIKKYNNLILLKELSKKINYSLYEILEQSDLENIIKNEFPKKKKIRIFKRY